MYEIYATDMEFEQCSPHKERIRVVVPYTVIHYVFSGSGTVNGQTVTEGSAFVSSVNSYVDYYPDKSDPWSYMYVRLYGEGVKKAFNDMGFEDGVQVISFAKHAELKSLLTLYEAVAASGDREGGKLIANALLLLHKEKEPDCEATGAQQRNALTIKQYIDNNCHKRITVLDLSERFHLSKNYIRNLFVKYVGVAPKQYIQEKRMDRARTLLLETDVSISTVALSVGYEDALLFSKMFSKRFSLSPQKYRQQKGIKRV